MSNKALIVSLILTAVAGLVYLLSPILLPFMLGVSIAYFLTPLVEKLTDKGMNRTLASFIPVLLFYVSVAGFFAILIPLFSDNILSFINRVPLYMKWVENATSDTGFITLKLAEQGIDVKNIISPTLFLEHSKALADFALQGLRHFIASALAIGQVLSLLLITPLVVFYLLADWPSFISKTKALLPAKQRTRIFSTLKDIDTVLAKFVRGQVVVCLLLGLFYAIALSAVGLEMGFVIGFLTGIISFIPYIGMLTGLIAAFAMAFMQYQLGGGMEYVLIACVFATGQVLEGFFLTPRFVGTQVGLHPVWVIFAVMAGGHLGGFLGILLALPLMAILTVLIPHILTIWQKNTN